MLLQVTEATNALLNVSKDQGAVAYMLSAFLILLGVALWRIFLMLQKSKDEVSDCWKSQLSGERMMQDHLRQFNEQLKDMNAALRKQDHDTMKELIANWGVSIRNQLNHEK